MKAIAVAATSYFIGSVPFSYIWAKVFSGIDIRRVGSRNVGTTNVVLSSGLIPGLLSGVGDLGKGVVAVLFAQAWQPPRLGPVHRSGPSWSKRVISPRQWSGDTLGRVICGLTVRLRF
jgi:glycerol-3-phosphate acyltransferase PlsY